MKINSPLTAQFLKSGAGRLFVKLFLPTLVICISLLAVHAQRRDHLTEAEADLVREAQQLDLRMEVFAKAIDRRVLLLNNPNLTQTEKESAKWGELPKGTRLQLLTDISKLLEEAIENVDDVASRDVKSPIFSKGVHALAGEAKKLLPQLQMLQAQAAEPKEQAAVLNSIDFCNQILESESKAPPEPTKEELKQEKKKKAKNDSN